MAALRLETCHIACSANRTPNVVSWGRGGTIAFGTCHSIALYDPQERRVLSMLNGHTARVNAVQWVHKEDGAPETHLVSGGTDSRLLLWAAHNGKFVQSVQCKGHTGAVCAVDALYAGASILVASAAADSSVRLWLCGDANEAVCLHSLTFGSGFVMDVSLALLPSTKVPVLACGGDDSRVHLFVQSQEKLRRVMTLQGHEDWVRAVAWTSVGGELLLASCSQDCLIRVWRLRAKSGHGAHSEGDRDDGVIKMKEDVFGVEEQDEERVFAVALETVLAGHENWVYGLHWQPPSYKGGERQENLSLLSASMDKTMILWTPDQASGVWTEQVRVGEVGGNTLGFYGCQMSPNACVILAHAFHGALHMWRKDAGSGEWRPGVALSGHFNAVQDLSWDPEGEFVISVSSDQTTRLFMPWRTEPAGRPRPTWHEVARPQIHGYDMQCLAALGRFRFVSGADEKVLRVFQAPRNFVENFANISGMSREELLASGDCAQLPEGASTPALGLSNKAVFQGDPAASSKGGEKFSGVSDQYQESYFHPINMTEPPPEDHLLQNTLWPEVQKLYGHGFEMFCLASDSGGTVVASACKASKAEHASVLLWSASTWRQLQALPCPALTVTQMAFSPDAAMLLPTAVTFCPQLYFDNSYLLAVGLECGRIIVYGWRPGGDRAGGQDWIRYGETDPSQSHTLAIKRLRWRPRAGRAGVPEERAWLQLASAGADHAVKIFDINTEAL
ncbi:elongator complex protein 2 [Hippocampus comes]|uniref:elongator complex protein 2 n=1 Tax=Hippocampus comes TaxID=109280 RepID=UPI00094E351B|nr:PREDICTED: elongator complex protein 2 [Hippocampus comes]